MSILPARRRSRLWVLGATALALLLLAACGSGASTPPSSNVRSYNTVLHLAMVTHGSPTDPFWIAIKAGAEQAAKDFNVQLEYLTSGAEGAPTEPALVQEVVGQHVQGVAMTAPDESADRPAAAKVTNAKIPLLIFNSGHDYSNTLNSFEYVGQDPTAAGNEAGTQMGTYGFRHVLCVSDEPGNTTLAERCDAMNQTLSAVGGGATLVNVPNTLAEGVSALESDLTKIPSIDGIVAMGPVEWLMAEKALTDHPLSNPHHLPHPIATFDATSSILDSVDDGSTLFALDQQPYLQGYLAVQGLAQKIRYDLAPFQGISTGPLLVDTNNAANLAVYALRQSEPINYRDPIYVSMVAEGPASDPFWYLEAAGAEQAAKDFGIKLRWWAPKEQGDPSQASLIKEALATNPDALAVTLSNDQALHEVKYAVSTYRPLVVYNAGEDEYQDLGTPETGGALDFIGQDDTNAGYWAAEQLDYEGYKNVLCVNHDADNTGLAERCASLAGTLRSLGDHATTLTVNGNDQSDASKAISQALAANPHIDAIMTLGDEGFQAADAALRSSNKLGKVKIAASDTSKDILQAIINGEALFTVNEQPYLQGYYSVETLAFETRLGLHPVGVVGTGPWIVTKQGASALLQFQNTTGG